jgi:hypothetical protein
MTDKAIVAVFDTPNAAYDAANALGEASQNGDFKVKAGVLVRKDENGAVSVQAAEDSPVLGDVVGGLVELIGGPAQAEGEIFPLSKDVASGVTADLSPGRTGIILEVEENSIDAIDSIIARSQGRVRRTVLVS